MEAVLAFLAQTVVSGAVGHYVAEGLKRIHPELAGLFDRKADTEEIKQFVEDHGLESSVTSFATEAVASSYIIPNVAKSGATLSTRARLFADVLEICFDVSNTRQMDLLLPGSFLGARAFTLFSRNSEGVPVITASGTVVKLSPRSNIENYLSVFPVGEHGPELWDDYRSAARHFRATTTGTYFSAEKVSALEALVDNCQVKEVSAGAVRFKFPNIMNSGKKAAMGVEGASALVETAHSSVGHMLEGLRTVLAIELLDDVEKDGIDRIYDKLSGLRDRDGQDED